MKIFRTIPLVALVAALLTGCFPKGDSETKRDVPILIEERTGSDVVETEYEWDDTGMLVGEIGSVNGVKTYEEGDYERDNAYVVTSYRTLYADDGSTSRQKRVAYYLANGTQYKFEAFAMGEDGDDTEPVESWVESYDEEGLPARLVQQKNGETVAERSDYSFGSGTMTYTLTEGDSETVIHEETRPGAFVRYRDWNESEWDGILIEERDSYTYNPENGVTTSYEITRYDDNGENPVVTEISIEYTTITIKF